MKLKVITATSRESSIEVNNSIFADKDNPALLAQAIRVYLSNLRQGTSKVKTRSQVSRTKSKWYRQKGTGNARHGSKNAPIFVGGGVAHGPKGIENWSKNLNSKMKAQALRVALRLQADNIFVTDNLNGLKGKTAEADALLNKMLGSVDKTLIVLGDNAELIRRSVNNIEQVLTINAKELNALHVSLAAHIILTKEALLILEARLKKPVPAKKTTAKPAKKELKKASVATAKKATKSTTKKPVKKVAKPTVKKPAKKATKKSTVTSKTKK
jgi:large subunit ribosomal protein L4